MIPLEADVLMVGVRTLQHSYLQRRVKDDLQSIQMGWNYVTNVRNSFDEAIHFITDRPKLDVVFIANQDSFSDTELRRGCTALAQVLAEHEAKPWVVMKTHLRYLRYIFEMKKVDVGHISIVRALCERHNQKCERERTHAA